MKSKLFFISILIGMSLQAQTSDTATTSNELDMLDQVDVAAPPPATETPAAQAITPPASPVKEAPVAVASPVAPVIIPRVYQILMPNKKQHEMTPSILAVGSTATDKTNPDIQYARSTVRTGLAYAYGIGNNQSVGAELNYMTTVERATQASMESSQKFNGLGNPSVHYNGLVNVLGVSLFGYVNYSFKLEKETFDTDKLQGNAAQGQNKTSVSIGGYKAVNSDYILGLQVHYTKAHDGEKTINTASSSDTFKLSKGDSMYSAVFMEFQNEWHPNITLGLIKDFSTEMTDQFDNKSYSRNMDFITMGASGQFETGKNVFFVPEISYASALKNDYFEKYGMFAFYGSLRLLF